MLRLSAIVLCVSLCLTVGCGPQAPKSDGRLRIVATTGLVADALRSIAGPEADVIALMGPGVDPHLYKATQGDLERLQSADLIAINGLHLEGKLGEVLERLGQRKPVLALGDGLDSTQLRRLSMGNDPGALDPHIWFDVQRWRRAMQYAAGVLAKQDTAHAQAYLTRAGAYSAQLDSLHRWVSTHLASIPPSQRVLVTAHDAFGYFGAAYGIEVRGLQGLSTASEFGLRDVSDLVSFLTARKIKAVFVETSVSPKAIEAVVEGCRARGHAVRIGGTLYSDALGEANGPASTYIGMVTENVNTIVANLK